MSGPRHVVTIDDLSDADIETIFQRADTYLDRMTEPAYPDRIRGKLDRAAGRLMATLFAEPSTRTRFSFETAMLRLGGQVLAASDAASTSFSKGETIADAVRVVENYADLIVIRSPLEGAARVAADFASVPVINGGDGSHQHPTQTLSDLYTLRREYPSWWRNRTRKKLQVLLLGDLKNGRTIHSLVYALARFGAQIHVQPAPGLDLPSHVQRRLHNDWACQPIAAGELKDHKNGFDAIYVTRFQAERSGTGEGAAYPVVDHRFLKAAQYRHARVLHPLPRVEELGYDLDDDPRGVYFKQAAFGVPVRMALISHLLGLHGRTPKAPAATSAAMPVKGATCCNPRCVSNNPAEARHLGHRLFKASRGWLRCSYCEHEIQP